MLIKLEFKYTYLFSRPYFTAEVFGRLQAAEGGIGRVRGVSLFNYVMRRVWLQQTRIGLSLYDVTGQGYLTEHVCLIYIISNILCLLRYCFYNLLELGFALPFPISKLYYN